MPKILIVDDDADMVEALKIVLESKGYGVDFAYDGDDGYRKAEKTRPDLVILDVMMKTKDEGFQVSYKMKNDPELKRIPILMLTAVGKETGFAFGKGDEDYLLADEFVEKPVKPSELVLKVERLIKKGAQKARPSRG